MGGFECLLSWLEVASLRRFGDWLTALLTQSRISDF
jgi:hypothetical protein